MCVCVCLVTQLCPTLCDRLLCPWNSPGKSTGMGCRASSRGFSQPRNWMHCRQILSYQGSPRILEWVAYPFFRGISLTQEINWGLLHCRQILYQLKLPNNNQKKPRKRELILNTGAVKATTAQESRAAFCWIGGQKIKFQWKIFLVN